MERMLECPVCASVYDPKTRVPKTLPCGHVFCALCVRKIFKHSILSCPTCRKESKIQTEEDVVQSLPTSFATLGFLETVCQACHGQMWKVKCDHCEKNVCNECHGSHLAAVFDTGEPIEDKLQKNSKELRDLISNDTTLEDIGNQEKQLLDHLKNTRELWTEILEQREKELAAKIKTRLQEIRDKYQKWKEESEACLEEAESLSTSDQDVKARDRYLQQLSVIQKAVQAKPVTDVQISYQPNTPEFTNWLSKLNDLKIEKTYSANSHADIEASVESEPTGSSQVISDFSSLLKQVHYKRSVGSEGNGDRNFHGLTSVSFCTRSKLFYVTDRLNHRIQSFTTSLLPVITFGTSGKGPGEFQCPHSIAVSRCGKLFITDEYNHRIQVMNLTGRFLHSFGSKDEYSYPKGLAIDNRSGFVYIVDSGNDRIQVVDEQGKHVLMFDHRGNTPLFIAVNPDKEEIAVSDSDGKICLYDTSGRFQKRLDLHFNGEMFQAVGLSYGYSGELVMSDNSGHLVTINAAGEIMGVIGTPGTRIGQLRKPRGVTCVPGRNTGGVWDVLVCDMGNNRLQMFGV